MSYLADLSYGLRQAAGVLNPDIQKQTFAADERKKEREARLGILSAQMSQSERHFQKNQALEERKLIETIKERAESRKLREATAMQLHIDKLELANKEFEFKGEQLKQGFELKILQLTDQRQRDAALAEYRRDELIRRRQQDAVNEELRRLGLTLQRDKLESGGLSGEAAGKVAMADQAVTDIRGVRNILFDKDGKLDRSLVAAMNVPFSAGVPGHANARSAYSKIQNAVSAKLRIETGAAATESEVRGILDRFLPKVSDPESVVKERLDRLEEFMNTTIDQTKGVRPEHLRSRAKKEDPLGIR